MVQEKMNLLKMIEQQRLEAVPYNQIHSKRHSIAQPYGGNGICNHLQKRACNDNFSKYSKEMEASCCKEKHLKQAQIWTIWCLLQLTERQKPKQNIGKKRSQATHTIFESGEKQEWWKRNKKPHPNSKIEESHSCLLDMQEIMLVTDTKC